MRLPVALSLSALGVFSPSVVFAVNWEVEPQISASLVFVDNIFLTESAPTDEITTEIFPSIDIRGVGNNIDVNLNYGARILNYHENDDADDTYHEYTAEILWDVVDNFFSIAASTSNNQQSESIANVNPGNPYTITTNRIDLTTYEITPQFVYTFNGVADVLISSSYSRVDYDNTTIDDDRVDSQDYIFELTSGSNFRRADWGLAFRRVEFNVDEPDRDDYTENSLLNFGYPMYRDLSWFIGAGTEKVVLRGVNIYDDNEIWNAGLDWNPSRRTNLRISVGNRAFGDSSSFAFSRRGRQSEIALTYDEGITNLALQQIDFYSSGNSPVTPQDISSAEAATELFISKRSELQFSFTSRNTTIRTEVYNENREFLSTSSKESYRGAGINWTRLLGQRANLQMGVNYSELTFNQNTDKRILFSFNTGISRPLYENMNVTASYTFFKQKPNSITTLTQNVVSVGVVVDF